MPSYKVVSVEEEAIGEVASESVAAQNTLDARRLALKETRFRLVGLERFEH